MGLTTYVVSIPGDYPGIAMADVYLEADITDEQSVVAMARRHAVDGVVSASTDLAILSIGAVVDALGLPGITRETAIRSTNKIRMKEAFLAGGVPTAAWRVVSSYEEAVEASGEIGYPLMVKAVAGMGGQGITKVSAADDLRGAWDRAVHAVGGGEVILEEFMAGLEFGAQAMAVGGQLRYVVPHNDKVSPPPYYSPIGHSFPMDLDAQVEADLWDCVEKGLAALGIDNGHANVDCVLTREGVRIIEIGARVGATCLPESTMILTGMDVYRQIIDLSLGRRPDWRVSANQPNAALYIMAPRTGTMTGFGIPSWVREDPAVYRLTMYAKPGQQVRRFTMGRDRIGEVIVTGQSAKAAEAKARAVVESIAIEVT